MVTTNHTTLRMSGVLNIEHLTALKLRICVNAHSWAIVEGEAGENALEQLSGALAGREQHILTLDESGAERCLFAGVIREAELVRVGGYNRFHVELLSGTCLMDREVRSRSFQDVGQTYSQVAQQVCSEYSGGAAICTVGEDKTLGQPVIQYRETDWEFLMRMASHCGGVLVPETHRGLPRLWFGFPDRSFTCEFSENAYTSGISQRYYELGGSAAGYSKADFFYYDVESPQLCDLGWYTVFKGQPFIISEKYAILERGELIFTYRLGRPGLGWGKMLYNEKISGMTLLGEVLETSRETLKLKLDIDAGWNSGGPYPYTWRPETGNFMYCMPRVGTRVSLYCPNYDEKAAIAVNCVRTNGGDCDRMSDPSKRSFVTEHGKEMNLYPSEMSLLGGSNGLFDLSDESGITIGSEKPVVIIACEEVKFEAAQVVTQALVGEIVAAKGDPVTGDVDSSLVVCNNYDAVAQNITGAEGWNCVAYGPYDDAPTESGFDLWELAFAVVGMVAAAAVIGIFSLTGIGAFVIGGLVAGAVSGALSAGKAALDAGLTGVDFLAAVGLGALVGGIQGAISGLISFGVFSGVAAAFGTTIAQLGLLKTMLAGGLSGGVISAGSQLIYTGEIDPWQVLSDTAFSSILTGIFYGVQNIRGLWGTDANGLHYAGIGDNQTGHGFLFGQSGGSVGGIYMNGITPVKGVAYIPGRGVVWGPQGGSVPAVQNIGAGTSLIPSIVGKPLTPIVPPSIWFNGRAWNQQPQALLPGTVNLLDSSGKFIDPSLENNYQKYVRMKIRKGEIPKERLLWKKASDYWTKESPMARGNNYNRTVRDADIYDYYEIHLENGKVLDSYDPEAGEIISRKATDLDQITEKTFREYLSEFSRKYSRGTVIRSNAYPELDGQQLNGQYILEIPASNANLDNIEHYKKIAAEYDVILRFTEENP